MNRPGSDPLIHARHGNLGALVKCMIRQHIYELTYLDLAAHIFLVTCVRSWS